MSEIKWNLGRARAFALCNIEYMLYRPRPSLLKLNVGRRGRKKLKERAVAAAVSNIFTSLLPPLCSSI